MHALLVALACVLACSSKLQRAAAGEDTAEYLKYHNVEAAANTADAMLEGAGVTREARSGRLAVMLLYTYDITSLHNGPCLKTSLRMYQDNLLAHTPTDLFLFVKQKHKQGIMEAPWLTNTSNLHVIELDESDSRSWKMPTFIRPESAWSQGFSPEYRLMGQWRLAFSFPFARELGYKYMLQADTDTYVVEPIGYNLVVFLKLKDIWMTNRNTWFWEIYDFYKGLPELANFWLFTRVPTDGAI
ncbi:hypothetical protein FOA52_011292 [Chlamydomonas sp. UWO 241]|nr:hypothetical protein FOA52_011292 [Chlamydomonas sp. UWO 241]